MESTRKFKCLGCGDVITVDVGSEPGCNLCEDCELVALAILEGDPDGHRERLSAMFERLERAAREAACDECGDPLGWPLDAILLSWANHERTLCTDCGEKALRAEEEAARAYADQVAANTALTNAPAPHGERPR